MTKPREWCPEASDALFDQYANSRYDALTTTATCPPAILTSKGVLVAFAFSDITDHPRSKVLWAWPGKWRTDLFITTASTILTHARQKGLVR